MAIRKRIRNKIQQTLEKRFMRYLVAAGIATVVDIAVYTLAYAFIFTEEVYFQITPEVFITRQLMAILFSYHCGLLVNFGISKYFVFKESDLRTGTQFLRFLLVAEIVFVANFLMTRFLWSIIPYLLEIDNEKVLALIIRTISAGTIGVLSFILHKIFSFEVQRAVAELEETEAEENENPAQKS
ncbi:MAG: GtrA family protein [Bacteroidetes bacterium]|nr:GtrA family protein [Bacteroidota bacterium]